MSPTSHPTKKEERGKKQLTKIEKLRGWAVGVSRVQAEGGED